MPGLFLFIVLSMIDTDDEDDELPSLPKDIKNLMTPFGFAQLTEELRFLMKEERPKIVEIVSWAAGNGDRSENGDYLYNKKRLREIDRRVRYLTKRLEDVEVVDPAKQQGLDRVFFGATVTYARADDCRVTVKLVSVDEADMTQRKINWLSPVALALMKRGVGDVTKVRTEFGVEEIEILTINYA